MRVEEVAATGRKLTGDSLHWPQSATEKMATESIMCQYQELEEKWPALVRDVEDWSNMLKTVLPEMKRFQVLYVRTCTLYIVLDAYVNSWREGGGERERGWE